MNPTIDTESGVMEVTEQDFCLFTDNYNSTKFICHAQYCNLYHGYIPQGWRGLEGREVTIKVWVKYAEINERHTGKFEYFELEDNFKVETGFLISSKATSSPYFPKLIAKCRRDENEFLGVVYDLVSSHTIRHFIDKVEFKWVERIKVAVGVARLLRFLHCEEPRYLVHDLSALHIMLDKDWNPVLFNYFNLTPRPLGVELHDDVSFRCRYGSLGYADPYYVFAGFRMEYSDVFAFGVILCELLFKRRVDQDRGVEGYFLYMDVWKRYPIKKTRFFSFKRKKEYSFVDESFVEEPGFNALDGPKISKLARLCVDEKSSVRPNIQQVLKCLEGLHVVRDHAEMFYM